MNEDLASQLGRKHREAFFLGKLELVEHVTLNQQAHELLEVESLLHDQRAILGGDRLYQTDLFDEGFDLSYDFQDLGLALVFIYCQKAKKVADVFNLNHWLLHTVKRLGQLFLFIGLPRILCKQKEDFPKLLPNEGGLFR